MRILLILLVSAGFLLAPHAFAQDSMSVTVTPPLIQLSIGPGETWKSALKVVNTNAADVEYYATPVDFEASGEGGRGTFIPLVSSTGEPTLEGRTLGHWIQISSDPILISRGTSGEIPFSIVVPPDAEPGGHYAAILVGTKPGEAAADGPSIRIASYVTSLIFLRIEGEVVEKGRIREFTTEKSLYEEPKADFLLRFENIGNTHLRPRGDVVIYNMWGKERGRVALNSQNNFGNVLPESIRKFSFSWEGEKSVTDIGRYSATVALGFGEDGKQSTSATTYFWVVPIIPVAATLGSIAFFLGLLMWLIRRYIRRALSLERQRFGIPEAEPRPYSEVLLQPLTDGAMDLRRVGRAPTVRSAPALPEAPLTFFGFFQKYSLFFFFLSVVAAGGMGFWLYLDSVLTSERSYEISNVQSGEENVSE